MRIVAGCIAVLVAVVPVGFWQTKKPPSKPTQDSAKQSKPDFDGWNKIKWGMTLGDAKKAIGGIDKIKIGKLDLGITLSAGAEVPQSDRYNDMDKSIAEVELSCVVPDYPLQNYEDLKLLLIEKYGTPTSDDSKPDGSVTVHRASWVFPSTVIVLNMRVLRSSGFLELTYQPANKKAVDAL
jgi:hypothetical protein